MDYIVLQHEKEFQDIKIMQDSDGTLMISHGNPLEAVFVEKDAVQKLIAELQKALDNTPA